MPFPAHIREDGLVQTVSEHSKDSAELSESYLESAELAATGYLAGLIHDMGKCSFEFREYINRASNGEEVHRGSVIHTFAAVRFLMSAYHSEDDPFSRLSAEIISSAVGGHHGLFDCFDENKKSGFYHRIVKQAEYDDRAIKAFFDEVLEKKEIDILFSNSVEEITRKINVISDLCENNHMGDDFDFHLALLTRLVTSAVIDADRTNTSLFFNPSPNTAHTTDDNEIWRKALANYNKYTDLFLKDTPIQKARAELSDFCYSAASKPNGLYSLKLPTGAGKTLSGLRFALRHAEIHQKERLFFISPLLTILEQNAKAIRNAVGDDSIVLEHHSDVVNYDSSIDEISRYELLVDSWNSPIVITTLVQFLNTLFSGNTSSIRRFHSLANSVIIIDEVQTIPLKMLSLFNTAMNFLTKICNTTVVICSATEPELSCEKISHPLLPCNEIVDPQILNGYKEVFERNKIEFKGHYSINEIPNLIEELFLENDSVLVVCNKKDEAAFLLNNSICECDNKYHLSAGMCSKHRKTVLDRVKNDLLSKKKVLCVSTQVIEAGVDISFDAVIRLCAGLDSIVQSAGRCNRNGECCNDAPVWIVDLANENLGRLKEIQDGKDATESLINSFMDDPKRFENDLSSNEAIKFYYEKLYQNQPEDAFDFIKTGKSLYSLLSTNENNVKEDDWEKYILHQAFKTAGELFEVFDCNQKSVIVPWGEGEGIINDLCSKCFVLTKKDIDRAKPFSVTVYDYQFKKLMDLGAIHEICKTGIYTLDKNYYDDIIGLKNEKGEDVWNFLMV